jgi:hypothetical protein
VAAVVAFIGCFIVSYMCELYKDRRKNNGMEYVETAF